MKTNQQQNLNQLLQTPNETKDPMDVDNGTPPNTDLIWKGILQGHDKEEEGKAEQLAGFKLLEERSELKQGEPSGAYELIKNLHGHEKATLQQQQQQQQQQRKPSSVQPKQLFVEMEGMEEMNPSDLVAKLKSTQFELKEAKEKLKRVDDVKKSMVKAWRRNVAKQVTDLQDKVAGLQAKLRDTEERMNHYKYWWDIACKIHHNLGQVAEDFVRRANDAGGRHGKKPRKEY